jgi:hypothetical protein
MFAMKKTALTGVRFPLCCETGRLIALIAYGTDRDIRGLRAGMQKFITSRLCSLLGTNP